ncbi:hypothetical protein [Mesorhizobium sp. M1A.T.Ca.IN.004.03.1.1]|uniref:hypothetical protein n=1 Tax=Mesorhizobium sp. M1A.T.Ca.IN.004.03.1.1 TaxID=2496795 RepID=UPI001FE063CF|nr:hypothetical protein [Mesorhizobium sp. M1A.T.Ca.IN.004.03.1.1]
MPNSERGTEQGAIENPATLEFPVITEIAKGTLGRRTPGGDPVLERGYVEAAQRLVQRGAVAISSNCGFLIRYQAVVAASVEVPVAMSSMLLLPTLIRQVPPAAKIAVLTYDSNAFDDDMLELNDPTERSRVVVGGIEGSKYWHDELKIPAPPTDVRGDGSGCRRLHHKAESRASGDCSRPFRVCWVPSGRAGNPPAHEPARLRYHKSVPDDDLVDQVTDFDSAS